MIKVKAITPKKFNAKAAIEILKEVVEETISEGDKLFRKTYRTWKHKPEFEIDLKTGKAKIIGSTTTDPDGSREHPYPFVTKGTKVRYALMSPDFSPKTTPRVIGSGAGSGGVLTINKNRPRPGIEAREFEEEIAKEMQPEFEKNGKKAEPRLAKSTGHKF